MYIQRYSQRNKRLDAKVLIKKGFGVPALCTANQSASLDYNGCVKSIAILGSQKRGSVIGQDVVHHNGATGADCSTGAGPPGLENRMVDR